MANGPACVNPSNSQMLAASAKKRKSRTLCSIEHGTGERRTPNTMSTGSLQRSCTFRKCRPGSQYVVYNENRAPANPLWMAHGKCTLNVRTPLRHSQIRLPARMPTARQGPGIEAPVETLGQRSAEIITRIISPVPTVEQRRRHRHHHINLRYIKPHTYRRLKPIGKIITQPHMTVKLEVQQHLAYNALKSQSRCGTVERRRQCAALFAKKFPRRCRDWPRTDAAATCLPDDRKAHHARRTDEAPVTIGRALA